MQQGSTTRKCAGAFNVYVSDLEKPVKSGGASMPFFADDFTLYCAKKSPHEAGRAVSDNFADALEMKGLSLSRRKQSQCLSHIDLQLTLRQ